MNTKFLLLPCTLLSLALPGFVPMAAAQIAGAPAFVDYQGTAFESTGEPLGSTGAVPGPYTADPQNYTMQFKIFDLQSAGTLIWAETQTVTVSLGQFAVRLGSGAAIAGLDPAPTQTSIANAFNAKGRYLELTVIIPPATTGSPITPRLAFQASPFAFAAERAKLADTATLANAVNGVVTATAGSTFTGTPGLPTTFTGPVSATDGISGNLTGDVTGDVTGNATSATTAANVTGTVAVANGGTGSTTQNFVDLTSAQSIAGNKNFTGNVGIGTTSPNYQLDIEGATPTLRMANTAESFFGLVLEDQDTPTQYGAIRYDSAGNILGLFNASPTPHMAISAGGNVGIGTTSPSFPLHVAGFVNSSDSSRYFQYDSIGLAYTSGSYPVSIKAEYGVQAAVFHAVSDRRIKDIVGSADGFKDLETVQKLRVTDYRMKDRAAGGDAMQKGFIAQEVQQEIPEAVHEGQGVVPSIYAVADRHQLSEEGQTLRLTMPRPHGLKKGDTVRLITDDTRSEHEVLEVVNDETFVVRYAAAEPERIFVYGKQVDDFLSVDYNRIFTTGISAIQQIKKEKDAEVTALQQENSELRTRLAAQERRLAAIEMRLATGEPSTRTVSLQGTGGVE